MIAVVLVVVVLVVVAAVALASRRRATDEADLRPTGPPSWTAPEPAATPRPVATAPAPDPAGAEEGLARIRAHDPNFDDQDFLNSAGDAFYLVEKGWTEANPALSRQVMDDGIWARHKAEMQDLKRRGRRNVLEEVSIGTSHVQAATSGPEQDCVTVRFFAVCRDYDIDVASGKVVRGSRTDMTRWQQDWVFRRSSTATTRPGGGVLTQHCPVCGAPLSLDDNGTCAYCKNIVMGGQHDWVLTRIDPVT